MKEINKDELEQVTGGGYCYYVVKYGDTLSGIAQYLRVSEASLISLNGIKHPDMLLAGTRLKYYA